MFVLNRVFNLPVGASRLTSELTLPPQASGLVMLAHSLSGQRASARCRYIRHLLQQEDLGTLSVDLLSPQETSQPATDAAASLLTQRLIAATQWAQRQSSLFGLRIGLLGHDETATTVLDASTELGFQVGAVVSFGGDLAPMAALPLPVPTLLLVGETDDAEPELRDLGATSEARPIAQADHLFQDQRALVPATQQAALWFNRYLARPSTRWPTN
jgi:putative phosphoribosyl transferase